MAVINLNYTKERTEKVIPSPVTLSGLGGKDAGSGKLSFNGAVPNITGGTYINTTT